jgi:DNA-binding response OmpR family regulator
VWEQDTGYSTNAVRVTLSKLRAKLGEPPLIETVPGAGYRVAAGPYGNGGGAPQSTGPR